MNSGDKRRCVSGEALKRRSDAADGTLVLWLNATTRLANAQDPGIMIL